MKIETSQLFAIISDDELPSIVRTDFYFYQKSHVKTDLTKPSDWGDK